MGMADLSHSAQCSTLDRSLARHGREATQGLILAFGRKFNEIYRIFLFDLNFLFGIFQPLLIRDLR